MYISGARSNLELKARCHDLAVVRGAVYAINATHVGKLEQTDTYFAVRAGRLKLRETVGHRSELIYYERADAPAVRTSRYHLMPVQDPDDMRTALSLALGIIAVVRKRRDLLLWHNVRIHLDQVENLGNFIELEAVIDPEADEAISSQRLEQLVCRISIRTEDLIACSYADLLRSKTPPQPQDLRAADRFRAG